MSKKPDLETLQAQADELGFELRPKKPRFVKTGFAIEEKLLQVFKQRVDELDMKIQDAVNEALTQWLLAHGVPETELPKQRAAEPRKKRIKK